MKYFTTIVMVIFLWAMMLAFLHFSTLPPPAPVNCTINGAYWSMEGGRANIVLESVNCIGGKAVFSIHEKDNERFVGNITVDVNKDRLVIPWSPGGSSPEDFYRFNVYISP